jgi:molybdate transport repressor ModE-like protein
MLDVTRLRVLVAVARQGSVTAAARELNYAQPSVSHHIARLEAETGTRLIERAGRGIRLTEAGRLLADRAAEIIGRLDAAEAELAAHVGLREDRVRLAAFGSALATLVPAAAARITGQAPGADLRLTEAEPPEAVRMLRAGSIDVALVFCHYQAGLDPAPPDPAGDGIRARLILDEPVFLVMAAGQEPAEPAAALAACGQYRWIAGCEGCRTCLLRQCEAAGFTPLISVTTDNYLAAQAMVAAGLGVTTLPGLCLQAVRHPGIATTELPGARRQVFALTYGDPPDPAITTTLVDALAAVCAASG